MAGSATNYGGSIILDWLFSGNVYLSLSTADLTEDASGNAEPDSTGSYARKVIAPADMGSAAVADPATITNVNVISFAESTAAWSTGANNLTHWGIWDALTAGNCTLHGDLTTPRAVNAAGITLKVPVGDLDVSAD